MAINIKRENLRYIDSSKTNKNLLVIHNLKKHFPIKSGLLQRTTGSIKAVDGLSFKVKRGETLGIVGESGCGKSTAAKTIVRLEKPTDGNIIYKGKDISHLKERDLRNIVRREIQMIFQDPDMSLNPRKTLEKTLLEPLNQHNILSSRAERLERIKELLHIVGLNSTLINRYPHEFSGGQKQRIGLARALTMNPELIIADEAVSALDVSIQAQVINLMEKLQEKYRLSYVFISHDLSVVRHISDRVAVMYLGKFVEIADKHELYDHPLHPYTQALLSAVPETLQKNMLRKERIILKGDIPSPENPPSGCLFSTRCPYVMDICKNIRPSMKSHSKNHSVACHLYDK